MSEKRYVFRLSEEERSVLTALLKTEERVGARKRMHAQVLLKVDEGELGPAWTDEKAAKAFDTHVATVQTLRRTLVESGFEAAINRKRPSRPPRTPVLDAAGESEVLAVAKGKAPKGRARWTLRLLAGELVRLEVVEAISHETVRKALKKTRCSPTCR